MKNNKKTDLYNIINDEILRINNLISKPFNEKINCNLSDDFIQKCMQLEQFGFTNNSEYRIYVHEYLNKKDEFDKKYNDYNAFNYFRQKYPDLNVINEALLDEIDFLINTHIEQSTYYNYDIPLTALNDISNLKIDKVDEAYRYSKTGFESDSIFISYDKYKQKKYNDATFSKPIVVYQRIKQYKQQLNYLLKPVMYGDNVYYIIVSKWWLL